MKNIKDFILEQSNNNIQDIMFKLEDDEDMIINTDFVVRTEEKITKLAKHAGSQAPWQCRSNTGQYPHPCAAKDAPPAIQGPSTVDRQLRRVQKQLETTKMDGRQENQPPAQIVQAVLAPFDAAP